MSIRPAVSGLSRAFRFARRIRRSSRRPAAVRPVAEAVEPRVLLASFAPFISGAALVEDGAPYRLNLSNSGGEAVTSWKINWGDDTGIEEVVGNPSSVTHPFPPGLVSHTITATASSATWTDVSAGGLALDPSFDSDGKTVVDIPAVNDYGYATVVQPDGKIVMAGWAGSDFGLIRLNADGSRDMSFDDEQANDGIVDVDFGTSGDRAYAMVLDPSADANNPRIVVAGSSGGNFALARFNPNGTLDATFSGDGKLTTDFNGSTDVAHAVAMSGTEIVVAGYATVSTEPRFAAARYLADGELDASFDGDGKATVDFHPSYTTYGAQAHAVGPAQRFQSRPRGLALQPRLLHLRLRPRPPQLRRLARRGLQRRRDVDD